MMDQINVRWQGWEAVTIGLDLRHLQNLLTEIEEFLNKKLTEFRNEFDEQTKDWSDDDKAEYGESLSDNYWELSDIFPQVFRSTFFLTCFSKFEYELKELCLGLKEFYPKLGNVETGKDVIKNCRKFLISEDILDESVFKDHWKNILVYKEVRNCFAHNSGYLQAKSQKEIESFIKNNALMLTLKSSKIYLEKVFCEKVIKDINELLFLIFENLRRKNIKTHFTELFG